MWTARFYLVYLLVIQLVAIVTGLTTEELSIISNYTALHRGGGNCPGLSITVPKNHTGFLKLHSTGVPNHPSYKMSNKPLLRQEYINHVPETPYAMPDPTCLPEGVIGFAINGVPFYSSLTSELQNAVQGLHAEVFDGCHGKVDSEGRYHYKELPALECLFPNWSGFHGDLLHDDFSVLIGVALDGFPIYFLNTTYFNWPWFTQLLDTCHGTTAFGSYRYYITEQFPYTLGCYRGEIYGNLDQINRETGLNHNCEGMDVQQGSICICGSEYMRRLLSRPTIPPTNSRSPPPETSSNRPHVFSRHAVTETDCHFQYNCHGPKYTDFCIEEPALKTPKDCSVPNQFGDNTCMPSRPNQAPGRYPPIRGDVRRNNVNIQRSTNAGLDCNQKQGSARILRIGCQPGSVKPPGPGGPKPPPPAPNRPGSANMSPQGTFETKEAVAAAAPPSSPMHRSSPPSSEREPIHLDDKIYHAGRPSSRPDQGKSLRAPVGPPIKSGASGPSASGPSPFNNGEVAPPIRHIEPNPPSSIGKRLPPTEQPLPSTSRTVPTKSPAETSVKTTTGSSLKTEPTTKKASKPKSESEVVFETTVGQNYRTTTADPVELTSVEVSLNETTLHMMRTDPPGPPITNRRPGIRPPVGQPRPPTNGRARPPSGFTQPKAPGSHSQPTSTTDPAKVTTPETKSGQFQTVTSKSTDLDETKNHSVDTTTQTMTNDTKDESETSSKPTLQPPPRNRNLPSNNGFPGPPIGYIEPRAPGTLDSAESSSDFEEGESRSPLERPPVVRLLPEGERPRQPGGPRPAHDASYYGGGSPPARRPSSP